MSWILYEEYTRPNYLAWIYRIWHFALGWQDILPETFDTAIVIQDRHFGFHLEQKGFRKRGQKLFDRIYENPSWFHNLHWEAKKYSDQLFTLSSKLKLINWAQLTDLELEEHAHKFLVCYHRSHDHGVLFSVLEFDHELLTKHLLKYLDNVKPQSVIKLNTGQVFTVLTTSTRENKAKQSRKSELEILVKINSNSNLRSIFETHKPFEVLTALQNIDDELFGLINTHYQSFCWLPYGTDGPAWSKKQLIKSLQNLLQSEKEPAVRLKEIKNEHRKIQKQQEKFYAELDVDEHHRALFQIAQDSVYLKAVRKDATSYGFYCAEGLFREMAKRMDLSLTQLRMFMPSELKPALLEKRFDPDELNSRMRVSAYTILNGKEGVLSGNKAQEFITRLLSEEIISAKIYELHGTCAVAGKARGIVKVIKSPRDISKMKHGDILVSYVTDVNLEPAMFKASAIVTDSGGMTSHAAIFAREFGITCLVGTKIATKVLTDGMEVEVDSEKGVVRILKSKRDDEQYDSIYE